MYKTLLFNVAVLLDTIDLIYTGNSLAKATCLLNYTYTRAVLCHTSQALAQRPEPVSLGKEVLVWQSLKQKKPREVAKKAKKPQIDYRSSLINTDHVTKQKRRKNAIKHEKKVV